jgi:DNA-binding MarR family transcriptional regulator
VSSLAIKSLDNYFRLKIIPDSPGFIIGINDLTKKTAAPDPADTSKLDDFLCFAIYSTNLAVNRLNKPVLDQLGLTYLQYIVIVTLYEQNDQTVGGLGEKLFLESSTLTPLLKRLEAMGHVTRHRAAEDERQVRVHLTPQGRKVREQALAFRSELVEAMGLDAADFRSLREQLLKLRGNLFGVAPAD